MLLFVFASINPFPLGLAIIPRRMQLRLTHFRSYASCNQLCYALCFQNGKESGAPVLQATVHAAVGEDKKEEDDDGKKIVWESKKALSTCWRTEKTHEKVSKFIMVFQMKSKQANDKGEMFLLVFV